MTFSAEDVKVNPVRCDPSGVIGARNAKHISDLLKQIGDQFNGQTLEDIINATVGSGGATLNYLVFQQLASQAITTAGEFAGTAMSMIGTIDSSTGTHAGTEYLAGERFQLEADGVTITDMTGGPPYIMTVGSYMRMAPVRDSGGYGWIKTSKRTLPSGVFFPKVHLEMRCPFMATDAPLPSSVGGADVVQLNVTRSIISDSNVGDQYKMTMGVIHGTNAPLFSENGITFLGIHYYD